MQGISESMAGRAAILQLPFTYVREELTVPSAARFSSLAP